MSSSQKQTTKSEPYAPAQPVLKDILSGAQDWLSTAQDRPAFGNAVAPMTQPQTQALQGIEQTASAGAPLTGQAQGYASDVLSGKYLDQGNPNFQAVTDSIRRAVQPAINSTFEGAGRTGSTANQYSLSKGLGDAIAPYAFSDYNNQLSRMDQAAAGAPALQEASYNPYQHQYQAGQLEQQQNQATLSDQMRQYYENQNQQLQALQQTQGLTVPIAGLGGTQNTTSSSSPNPLTMALGGAMTAASLVAPPVGLGMSALGGMIPGMTSGGQTGVPFAPFLGSIY